MNEINLVLKEFERNPEDEDIQEKILHLAREQFDSSELVQKIMERCVSKISKKGRYTAVGSAYDFSTGKSESVSQQLDSPVGFLGKLHSEHLYLAAKCLGCAQRVNKEVVDKVITCLLSEFDLEVIFPQAAIAAFADIGERAVSILVAYLKDRKKETFSREDAALALGRIGSHRVVEELSKYLAEADIDDKAMPLYALGETRNPEARAPILNFLSSFSNHPKTWVAQEALEKIS